MTAISIALFASCLPAALAITAARRAGYEGFLGFAVWCLESLAGWLWFQARKLRRMAEALEEVR